MKMQVALLLSSLLPALASYSCYSSSALCACAHRAIVHRVIDTDAPTRMATVTMVYSGMTANLTSLSIR